MGTPTGSITVGLPGGMTPRAISQIEDTSLDDGNRLAQTGEGLDVVSAVEGQVLIFDERDRGVDPPTAALSASVMNLPTKNAGARSMSRPWNALVGAHPR